MVKPASSEVGDAFVSEAEVAFEGVDDAAVAHGEDVAVAAGGGEDVVERRQDSHEHSFVVLPAGRPFAPVEHAGELRIDIRSR